MEWGHWILLVGGAVGAGIVNTLAGGGSLITVPLLVVVGLEPNVANGTNRLGVLVQSVVASWTFRRSGIDMGRLGRLSGSAILATGLLGALAGAYLATRVSNDTFRLFFALTMLPVAALVFAQPKRWLERLEARPVRAVWLAAAFVFVGLYAGFVQAGVGIIALMALVGLGAGNLVSANAFKVFAVAVFALLSLVIFALNDQVDLLAGLVLATGSALGGYLGGLLAAHRGERWIRGAVLLASVALSIRLLVAP
jgi:hypothetical protein